MSEIHHISLYKHISSGTSNSSRTTSYRLIINSHDNTDPQNKIEVIRSFDKKRKLVAFKLVQILEKVGIMIRGRDRIV